jgi:hypothetical protein
VWFACMMTADIIDMGARGGWGGGRVHMQRNNMPSQAPPWLEGLSCTW